MQNFRLMQNFGKHELARRALVVVNLLVFFTYALVLLSLHPLELVTSPLVAIVEKG